LILYDCCDDGRRHTVMAYRLRDSKKDELEELFAEGKAA
jgi:hypothetical protein